MFDQIFERSDALRRQYAAPLLEERKAYLRHWAEVGAPREHLRHLARCLLVITKRLHLQSNSSVTVGQIKRAADQWARRPFQRDKSRFVGVATKWLRFLGRLQVSEDRTHSFAQLMADFEKYLDQERALAPRTIKDHCWRVENFLRRALHVTRGLSGVTIRQIDKGLALKGRQSGHPRQAIRSYASCLRLFFRYAEQRNLCRRGLADTITAPRMYRHEALPSHHPGKRSNACWQTLKVIVRLQFVTERSSCCWPSTDCVRVKSARFASKTSTGKRPSPSVPQQGSPNPDLSPAGYCR